MIEIKDTVKKLLWIRDLRVIATVCVIIIHISCRVFDGSIGSYFWWVGNVFDSSVRFAVPVFVMLSGALLLPKEYELGSFFKKKALRIILPFIFWILFYIFFYLLREIHNEGLVSIHYAFKFIISNLYNIPIFASHFWYIYMLIGLYLLIPIIGKWVRIATTREIEYFLVLWLLTVILSETRFGLKLIENLNLNFFSGYLGYLILGYYLSTIKMKWSRKTVLIISFLFILFGALITVFGTWQSSLYKGSYDASFHNYLSLNVLILSMGVFLFVRNLKFSYSNIGNTILNFIDKYSYGIYLIHIFVLECLVKLKLDLNFWSNSGKYPILGMLITTALCLCVSSALICLINKLPYGKYVSGGS